MQNKRAKQFMPFAPLKGFKEALREKEKVIVPKKVLTNDDIDNLNFKIPQLKKGMIVKVVYYSEGNYIELEGMISKVDHDNKILTIVKTKIYYKEIYDIKGKSIIEYR